MNDELNVQIFNIYKRVQERVYSLTLNNDNFFLVYYHNSWDFKKK